MANFLIFSGIGPTKHFFGCFPVRVGVFFVFLLNVAVLVFDLLEHMRVLDKDNSNSGLVNQWITFSIQVSVSVLIFINLIIKHGLLGFLSYFIMFALTIAICAEKLTKIVLIYKCDDWHCLAIKSTGIKSIDLAFIYAYRCLGEFFINFYCTYILYSYSQEKNAVNNQAKEEFVKS